MIRNQDSNAGSLKVENDLLQVENGYGIDPGERLVQQDECGIDAESARNLNSSALSSRKRPTPILANVLQPQLLNQLFHFFPVLVPGN